MIQQKINAAADGLQDALNSKKAANESVKELRKSLKDTLETIPEYQELEKRDKELKRVRKEMNEELKEIKRSKEQLALETDEQKELDDFIDRQEIRFAEVKDRVVVKLSRELASEGMVAEVNHKSGQLILIVARA